MGNGADMPCEGQCFKTPLLTGGKSFPIDLYVLPIYGAYLVLGVQWLADIGEATFKYKLLTMEFQYQGSRVRISERKGSG